jgi:hypothetical protein
VAVSARRVRSPAPPIVALRLIKEAAIAGVQRIGQLKSRGCRQETVFAGLPAQRRLYRDAPLGASCILHLIEDNSTWSDDIAWMRQHGVFKGVMQGRFVSSHGWSTLLSSALGVSAYVARGCGN